VYLSSVYTFELYVLDMEATKWLSAQQIIFPIDSDIDSVYQSCIYQLMH